MSKGGKQEVIQSTQLDPATRAFLEKARTAASGVWNAASSGARFNPGINSMTQQGQQALGQQQNALGQLGGQYGQLAGNLGMGTGILQNAAQGNVSQFMDPYQQQVIGGVQQDFDRQRAMANNQAADMATKGGFFGGSREAILRSQAMDDVNRNETSTLAGLRSQGYGDAMNRAQQFGGTLANLGLGGMAGQAGTISAQNQITGQQMQAGEYNRSLTEAQNAELYNRKMQGLGAFSPFIGAGGTTTSAPMSSNPLMSGLGGAATGASIGSIVPGIGTGIGAAIGGGIGLFGGLF
jgi:hypothetical protein